jgi:hypothetical protein
MYSFKQNSVPSCRSRIMVRTAMLRILTTGLTAALGAVTAAEYFIGNEAPILVITEGRSGSTLGQSIGSASDSKIQIQCLWLLTVGELFNQSPRVMYFYEPCRSLDPHVRSRSLAISESLERQKSCPDLVQAVCLWSMVRTFSNDSRCHFFRSCGVRLANKICKSLWL